MSSHQSIPTHCPACGEAIIVHESGAVLEPRTSPHPDGGIHSLWELAVVPHDCARQPAGTVDGLLTSGSSSAAAGDSAVDTPATSTPEAIETERTGPDSAADADSSPGTTAGSTPRSNGETPVGPESDSKPDSADSVDTDADTHDDPDIANDPGVDDADTNTGSKPDGSIGDEQPQTDADTRICEHCGDEYHKNGIGPHKANCPDKDDEYEDSTGASSDDESDEPESVCRDCGATFESYRQLSGHVSTPSTDCQWHHLENEAGTDPTLSRTNGERVEWSDFSAPKGNGTQCQNCGTHLTKDFARVFEPESEGAPRVCPMCEDLIRERDGTIREARSTAGRGSS